MMDDFQIKSWKNENIYDDIKWIFNIVGSIDCLSGFSIFPGPVPVPYSFSMVMNTFVKLTVTIQLVLLFI